MKIIVFNISACQNNLKILKNINLKKKIIIKNFLKHELNQLTNIT
jgi:hypothetical protein